MKLLYRITLRVSIAILILFAAWSVLFYYIIIDEINDETDDSLEDYSEFIIRRALAGEDLPETDNGTNNSYYIIDVTRDYAEKTPSVRFLEETVYIHSKKETEPARIYKTIFRDRTDRYYELTVMIPTIEKKDLKETILFWIVILYVLLLLAIIVVNAVVLRRSLQPLYIMLEWLDKLSLNEKTPALDIDSDVSEFRKLSEALLRSAHRNAEAYEQQSLFIGHASHELQTPIAIALNRLEVLADEPGVTESQLLQILKTKESLESVSKLNKTLLLMTKIENNQYPESKEIDVNELVYALLSDFGEAYGYLKIEHEVREEAHLRVKMNETLALVLVNNLIKNAYIHNFKEGQVRITITSDSIRIANTAQTGALNPEYIFRRFYQGVKKDGSAGLGLSLVDSVCRYYTMRIGYAFDEEMHHFEIGIPDRLICK